jgi:hypothetical protein
MNGEGTPCKGESTGVRRRIHVASQARWFKYSVMEALKRRHQNGSVAERTRATTGCRETAQGISGRSVD